MGRPDVGTRSTDVGTRSTGVLIKREKTGQGARKVPVALGNFRKATVPQLQV